MWPPFPGHLPYGYRFLADADAWRARGLLGQGAPAASQYSHYLLRLLHGNLGQSQTVGFSVNSLLWRALPPTLSLMIGAMILWLATGVVVGTVSALRPGSWAENFVTGVALGVLVIPTFLLALLLLGLSSCLSVSGNRWMQPGYVSITSSLGQWLGRMMLPWVGVAATQAAVTAKLTRTAILEVLSEEYIRTAPPRDWLNGASSCATCYARRAFP